MKQLAADGRRILAIVPELVTGFPYSVGSLMAPARAEGFAFDIDLPVNRGESDEQIARRVEHGRYSIAALTGHFPSWRRVRAIVEAITARTPEVVTCLGGPLITSAPAFVYEQSGVDVGFVGEADVSFPKLLRALRSRAPVHDIPGLVFRDGGSIVSTGFGEVVPSLDRILPIPWDEIPEPLRLEAPVLFPEAPAHERVHTVLGARGCPFSCNFCFHVCPARSRSPREVVAELRMFRERWGVRWFNFADSILLGGRHDAFCRELIAARLDVQYKACTRFHLVNRDTLALLRDSGCVGLGFGLESGNQAILDAMGKRCDLDHAARVMDWAREVGLPVGLTAMFGQPGENADTLFDTLRWLFRSTSPPWMFVCQPNPGTELFRDALRQGHLRDEADFLTRFHAMNELAVNLSAVSDDEFRRLWRRAQEMLFLGYPAACMAERLVARLLGGTGRGSTRTRELEATLLWHAPRVVFDGLRVARRLRRWMRRPERPSQP